MRLRGDGKLGLIILAAGLAPAIIKKSKPLANYLSDQLARASEYLRVEDKPEKVDDAAAAAETRETEAKVEEVTPDPVEPVASVKPKRKTPATARSTATPTNKAAAKPKPKPTKSQG